MKKISISISIPFLILGCICSALLFSCSLVDDTGNPDFVVREAIPANGSIDIPTGIVISISFSVDIYASTATTDTVVLTDSKGKPVPGKVFVNGVALSFAPGIVSTDDSGEIFTPILLASSEAYHLTITTQLKDIYGRSLPEIYSMGFTTAFE
jgi:hypothetical protein